VNKSGERRTLKGSFIGLLYEPILWLGVLIPGYAIFLLCRHYASIETVPPWKAWLFSLLLPAMWGTYNWAKFPGIYIKGEWYCSYPLCHEEELGRVEGFWRFDTEADRITQALFTGIVMLPFSLWGTRRSINWRKDWIASSERFRREQKKGHSDA